MEKCKLGDEVIVNMGQSPESKYYNNIGNGTPFIQGNRNFGYRYPLIDTYTTKKTKIANKNDILMTVRAPVGELNIAQNDICIGRGVCSLKMKNGNQDFLFYLLNYCISNLIKKSNGTTFGSVNKSDIENLEIVLPSITVQNKISYILSLLDNKVELVSQIINELKIISKQLYDYWFQQFEFPDVNGNPYKSNGGKMIYNDIIKKEIPECWKVKNIFDSTNMCYGIPLATDKFDNEKGIPVIRIRDILNNTTSAFTSEIIDEKYLTKPKDLLVGMDGNFHMNFWNRAGDCVNQRIMRIRDKDSISTLQVYYQIYPYIKDKENHVACSTVGHLSDGDFKSLYIYEHNNKFIYSVFDYILQLICNYQTEKNELITMTKKLNILLMNGQVKIID